jgi:CheY-like chemotaxis protein
MLEVILFPTILGLLPGAITRAKDPLLWRTALVVDDMADNRRVLEAFLNSIGFDVLVAVDGTEAVAAAAESRPDIVFMDLVMPGLSGFDATRTIRSLTDGASVPIVAVSADAFDETRSSSDAAGFNVFITKPVRFENVLDAIEGLLHLEWRYEKDEPTTPSTGDGVLDVGDLPPEVAHELLHLARIGDVQALGLRVGTLTAIDPGFERFAERLAALTRQYDLRSVLSILSAASNEA